MPWSSPEGKEWAVGRILAHPGATLDVGCGAGTWAKLLNGACRPLWGVEIWAPYIYGHGLQDLYDAVIVADARTVPFGAWDWIILGDVLEHMHTDEAVAVWEKARTAARTGVVLSIPIIDYPQGPYEGNVHETHLTQWTHDLVLDTFHGITDHWTGHVVGVYIAPGEAA